MTKLKKRILLYLYLLSAFAAYLVLLLLVQCGLTPPFLHPIVAIFLLIVSVVLLWAGNEVRKLKEGEASAFAPAQAPYVVLCAQVSAIWSVIFLGCLSGFMALLGHLRHSQYFSELLWRLLLFMAVTIILLGVGLVVEKWCSRDSGENLDSNGKRRLSKGGEQEGCAANLSEK